MSLSITTRRLADGTVEIRPVGEIDLSNVHEVVHAVRAALSASAPPRIAINLWLVTLLDSSGMGALVSCHGAAAAALVPLVVTDPTALVHHQLRVAGLIELLGSPQPR